MSESAEVFSIKRFAVHDGAGIRTTVFLTGCPLRCEWCHNPEGFSRPRLAYYPAKCISCGACVSVCPSGAHAISDGRHIFLREKCTSCGACEKGCLGNALIFYGRPMTTEDVLSVVTKDRDFYGEAGGVTLSGGECLLHPDFCLELAKALHREGIGLDIDTSGEVPWTSIEPLLPYVDTFLYDVKAASSERHKELTGVGNERIIENLHRLCEAHAKVEVRIPYVPGRNSDEMDAIRELLAPLPLTGVRLLPYHNFASAKYESLGYQSTLPVQLPTSAETERETELFRKALSVQVL